jgi:hypothetical protein
VRPITHMIKRITSAWQVFVISAALTGLAGPTSAQQPVATSAVSATEIAAEVRAFTAKEIAAHFGNIRSLNPPPERVFGALTVGDFSWGSFARALAAQADLGGNRTIAGRDTARAIAEMGLIESRQGGKSFAQLYSTLALRHYGTDLSRNAVWQSMSESERKEWNSLLDPTRFYDANKRAVINLPENYLGVAARVSAMSFQMGVLKDRAFLDSVVERAAEQFTRGAIYADDAPPTGRYDRYSHEYVRFCWDAADIAGREDIKDKLRPSLKSQMRLWWDIVSPAGYGYNWGRSQGLVSYLDTIEIAAFLAQYPEFRPAQLAEIAALYNQAWRWIRADYDDKTHMFSVFAYGRGNYAYINPSREWQQTGTGLGKIILAHEAFVRALVKEGISSFPTRPTLPNVARFEWFARGEKKEGVWVYRDGELRFALPVTVGPRPAIADYLPAPYGLPGFAAPVEEVYPALVPFVTLADGKTYAASDGADEIRPATDGRSLTVVNTKWAQLGSKSGERFDNGLRSEVEFRIVGPTLVRTELLTATRNVVVDKWLVAVSTTASSMSHAATKDGETFTATGRDGTTAFSIKVPAGFRMHIEAAGDSAWGKGVLGAIPLHIVIEAKKLDLRTGQRVTWELRAQPGR